MKELELILNGGRVKRYHAKPLLHEETVGHHSFIVAWLCTLIWKQDNGDTPSAILLLAALQHDLPECVTGDVPSPSKRKFGISEQFSEYEKDVLRTNEHALYEQWLTAQELRILGIADKLAGIIHCLHERRMGNRYLESTYLNYVKYLEEAAVSRFARSILNYLEGEWNECQ